MTMLYAGVVTFLLASLCTVPLRAWQQVNIQADRQTLLADRYVCAVGNVSVAVDDAVTVSAPKMYLDQKTRQLYAQSSPAQKLRIDYDEWYALADHAQLNWQTQAGRLLNVQIYGTYGVVRAHEMQRDAGGVWHLHNATYSGCTSDNPHWSLTAQTGTIKSDQLSAYGVAWRVGSVPLLYLPWLRTNINKKQTTGLLLPQVSYDAVQGVGLAQKLFVELPGGSNTTVGVAWRSRRGTIWSGALHGNGDVARTGDLSIWYGTDRKGGLDRFAGQMARDSEYWLSGSGVYAVGPVQYLGQVAYGSDKRVSETFFTAPSDRDNSFANTAGVRWQERAQMAQVSVRHDLQVRNTFTSTLQTRSLTHGHEQYAVRRTYYVPQVRWYGTTTSDVLPLSARHELGGDWTIVRNAEHAITYDPVDSAHIKHAAGQHMGRVWYHGQVNAWAAVPGGSVQAQWQPYLQGRVRGYKIPREATGFLAGNDVGFTYKARPVLMGRGQIQGGFGVHHFDGRPELELLQVDEYERCKYGQEATAILDGCWSGDEWSAGFSARQSWQLGAQRQALPTLWNGHARIGELSWQSRHQFCWQQRTWVTHEVELAARTGPVSWQLGVLHGDPWHMRDRKLFFDGGTIVSCGMKWYHSQQLSVWYAGRFMYQDMIQGFQRLAHDVGVSYEGHCWSVTAGYKEVPYVQYGRRRAQQSLYLMLSLRPLGRVGATFKQWR